jgi:hypothetical protein
MIFLILVLLAFAGGLGYQKYRGNQALTFTHIDVTGISLEQIVAVGGKASGSLAGRLTGNTPGARLADGGAEWQANVQGSVMSFRVDPLPGGQGYRVGGAATTMRIGQTRIGSDNGIWGLSKAMSNALFRMMGIPHNAPALIRRRKRVLRAVANAGTLVEATPVAEPATGW